MYLNVFYFRFQRKEKLCVLVFVSVQYVCVCRRLNCCVVCACRTWLVAIVSRSALNANNRSSSSMIYLLVQFIATRDHGHNDGCELSTNNSGHEMHSVN